MIKRNFTLPAFIVIVMLLAGCTGRNQSESTDSSDTSGISISPEKEKPETGFHIKRYEKALFELDKSNLKAELEAIRPGFSVFLGKGNFSQDDISQISDFIADENNKSAFAEVLKKFPDLKDLNNRIKKAYENYSRETGVQFSPNTYTYISGYDFQYPIKYADTVMIIALDMYLGSDFDMYKKMGIPVYISSRYTPAHIIPDCLKEIAYPHIPEKKGPYTLLDAMIEQGKLYHFVKKLSPDVPDHIVAGFSKDQLKWCTENESNLWQFIIENELLYSTDSKSMSMFMVDGPFTSSFSQDSPARTGAWLGWQIVNAYMKKNNTPLLQMTGIEDSREILEKSGYKPKKR
jgi:uncharacterized protein YjaZ